MKPIQLKNISRLIEKAGGLDGLKTQYVRIENPPYMRLVIEHIGAMNGLDLISVAHYGEQNGDAMRDPEMCFMVKDSAFYPTYYRNDYVGVERKSVRMDGAEMKVWAKEYQDECAFAKTWDRNIGEQGFIEAMATR